MNFNLILNNDGCSINTTKQNIFRELLSIIKVPGCYLIIHSLFKTTFFNLFVHFLQFLLYVLCIHVAKSTIFCFFTVASSCIPTTS